MEERYIHILWRRFRHHKAGYISFIILMILIVLALLTPWIAPYDPNAIDPQAFSAAPGMQHLLGTDVIGRDILSRLLHGMRVSLFVGFFSTVLATGTGVLLGLVSGYYGGFLDHLLMRFTDMIMSFPYILLILVAGIIFRPGMWTIIWILGFVDWPGVARLVRGNVLNLKEQDFIHSAEVAGFSQAHILFREILPNCIAPILIFATGVMAISILDEASLSFLGMGIQPPQASLGNMLNGAQSITVLTSLPWLWIPPGVVIILLVMCTNFIGDGLREAIDPSAKR